MLVITKVIKKTTHTHYPSEDENNVEVTVAYFPVLWAVNNQNHNP
jgi:hypothetical protein